MRLLHDPKDAAKQIHQGARWRVPCAGDPGRVALHWSADLRGGGVEGRQSTGRREGKEGSLRLGGGGGGRFFLVGVAAARGAKVGGVAVVVGLEPTNPLSKVIGGAQTSIYHILKFLQGKKNTSTPPPIPNLGRRNADGAGWIFETTNRQVNKQTCLQTSTKYKLRWRQEN